MGAENQPGQENRARWRIKKALVPIVTLVSLTAEACTGAIPAGHVDCRAGHGPSENTAKTFVPSGEKLNVGPRTISFPDTNSTKIEGDGDAIEVEFEGGYGGPIRLKRRYEVGIDNITYRINDVDYTVHHWTDTVGGIQGQQVEVHARCNEDK